MVNILIKLIAGVLGRQIERGSAKGAFACAALGVAAGIAVAYAMQRSGWVPHEFSVAIYLIFSIPIGIAGALIGAAIGPIPDPVLKGTSIRLTRYNRAAGTLAVGLIFLIAAIVLPAVFMHGEDSSDNVPSIETWAVEIAVVFFALISSLVAVLEIWSIELGPTIRIRRIWGTRLYRKEDLSMWGFQTQVNEVIQRPFSGTMTCCLQFADRKIYRIQASGTQSQSIIELLGKTRVPSHAPMSANQTTPP